MNCHIKIIQNAYSINILTRFKIFTTVYCEQVDIFVNCSILSNIVYNLMSTLKIDHQVMAKKQLYMPINRRL